MASIRLKVGTLNNTFNDMVSNTGSSRTDDYYFDSKDIPVDNVEDQAFNKKLLINITHMYGTIYKLNFNLLMT